MKIVSLMGSAMIYFCVATVIAQSVALGVYWTKGGLGEERVYQMLAVVHGIDPHPASSGDGQSKPEDQVSLESVIDARVRASLDHDLREMAFDKGLADLINLEAALRVERTRYDELKKEFDEHVANLQSGARSESLKKLQQILETMPPKQAKDQLLMMMESDDALDDVVTIVKAMPADKRKKVLVEFKVGDEPEDLFKILREVRLGMPEVRQIQKTREQLDQLKP